MIIIAGPCVIEDKETLRQTVEKLLESISNKNIDFYFKSSWRKDNRTTPNKFTGLDQQKAISYLIDIKKEYNVKICTDFHLPQQLDMALDIDMIQIPAFLAKQLEILEAASKYSKEYNKILHIKKPQFVGPEDTVNIINNVYTYGTNNAIITDRGTMLGYNQVFMDPRHVNIMKSSGAPVLVDITHPNKNYPGNTKNNSETLGQSYIAAGADGIFLEAHPKCDQAKCDADTMLDINQLPELISKLYKTKEHFDELFS